MQLGQQRSEAMRKFRQARSPPLLFRGGGTTGWCFASSSTRLSSQAATSLCTVTGQHCSRAELPSCLVLAQATPSPGERPGDMPWAGETLSISHPSRAVAPTAQAPLAAQLTVSITSCPLLTARMTVNTEKALDTVHRVLTSGRQCKKTQVR